MAQLHFALASVLRRSCGVFLAGAFLVGGGCRGPEKYEIGTLTATPTTVAVGGRAEIRASDNLPEGTHFRFFATRGQCFPDTIPEIVLTTFCAASEPGDAVVRVEAVRGRKTLAVGYCTITVVQAGNASLPPPPSTSAAAAASQPTFLLHPNGFRPSGWTGDGEEGPKYVHFAAASREDPFSLPTCQKWSYTTGPAGFASVAWQYPENNWGDRPGLNLSDRSFTRLSWYARGLVGGEEVDFFAGGHTDPSKPYQSSFDGISITVTLTRDWRLYALDLTGKDLSSVICPFGWTVRGNPDTPVTFYLDDIALEAGDIPQTLSPPLRAPSSDVAVAPSEDTPATPPRPVVTATPSATSAASTAIFGFVPSGWMGDGEEGTKYLKMDSKCTDNPHSAPSCLKWTYTKGDAGWAAVAWQFPANNFGAKRGMALAPGVTKVTWWARALKAGTEIEFFAGGNTAPNLPNQSTLERVSTSVTLTAEWKQYSLDIKGDHTQVMCAFGWSTPGDDEPIVFFLDDIQFE